jgi:hypothetical protein
MRGMKKKMERLGREMKDGKMGRGPQAWDRRNNNLQKQATKALVGAPFVF